MPRPLQAQALLSLLLALASVVAVGCAGEPPPVATVEVELEQQELPHQRFTALGLQWKIERQLAGRSGPLRVFVHLLDEPGGVVRTFDHPWPGPWRVGGRVEYRVNLHQSALAPPLEPGTYALSLGLYDGEGRRWPLATRGEVVDRQEYQVAKIRVPPAPGGGPSFQFPPDFWLDSEAGTDRQILARRWLTGPGHLRLGGLERPGELWLQLVLPAAGGGQKLVFTDDAGQQGAVVGSDCGDVQARLAGLGSHDIVLPITPGAGGNGCAVHITPNFYLLELESGARRAVSLDVLAWSPG